MTKLIESPHQLITGLISRKTQDKPQADKPSIPFIDPSNSLTQNLSDKPNMGEIVRQAVAIIIEVNKPGLLEEKPKSEFLPVDKLFSGPTNPYSSDPEVSAQQLHIESLKNQTKKTMMVGIEAKEPIWRAGGWTEFVGWGIDKSLQEIVGQRVDFELHNLYQTEPINLTIEESQRLAIEQGAQKLITGESKPQEPVVMFVDSTKMPNIQQLNELISYRGPITYEHLVFKDGQMFHEIKTWTPSDFDRTQVASHPTALDSAGLKKAA